jgi:Tle cognate immunity protein 4 C-terminal domain
MILFNPFRALPSLCVGLALLTGGCNAADVPADWKPECVGRMQISLPPDVEVAATSTKIFENYFFRFRDRMLSLNPKFTFADGEDASYGDISGIKFISHKLTSDEVNKLRQQFWVYAKEHEAYFKKSGDKEQRSFKFMPVVRGAADMEAYSFGAAVETLHILGNHVLIDSSFSDAKLLNPSDHLKASLAEHQQNRNNLRFRPLFEVPSEPGLCFPHVFLKDDGKKERNISAAYRLKRHPDVTVWFEDSSAKPKEEEFSDTQQVDYFWMRRNAALAPSFGYLNKPEKPILKLAGFYGRSSFVELKRKDGSQDFGYFAHVKGDDRASLDSPTLSISVIRDAKNAKGTPVSKEELKQIADQIAASVKYRAPGPAVNPPKPPAPPPPPPPAPEPEEPSVKNAPQGPITPHSDTEMPTKPAKR